MKHLFILFCIIVCLLLLVFSISVLQAQTPGTERVLIWTPERGYEWPKIKTGLVVTHDTNGVAWIESVSSARIQDQIDAMQSTVDGMQSAINSLNAEVDDLKKGTIPPPN